MQDLRVAIIQTSQFWEDKEANLNYFEEHFLSKLKKSEVDLVMLPEMFSTSFSMHVDALAEAEIGSTVAWMKSWASKLRCEIGGTLIIKENNSYFNRFLIVSENGVQARYNKRHLFRMAKENDHFTMGTERVVYSLKGWKILLQVCYDLRFPVYSRNKTIGDKKEYDLVIYPANWPEKRASIWSTLLKARAIENQAYCIGINRVGRDGNDISYSGDSVCIDPWGNVDYQFAKYVEEVKILTVKRQILNDIERQFPAFKDAD
jgi:omega-amidase